MKSNVSDYLELMEQVYIDASMKCLADVSDLRDLETIRSRVKDEGLSFLTITLPNFCKDFERSLALGKIDPTCFRSFRKHGAIPVFLQGMLGLVFDRETGRINDDDTNHFPILISTIRQICLLFKKVEIECTPERVRSAIDGFADIEQAFNVFSLPETDIRRFRLVASVLWDNILANIRLDKLSPRHGPGKTADRISGNQKYAWRSWHERLEPYFPFLDNAYSISAFESREFEIVTFVKPEEELPVRVVPVPKTLKGPRIIAIEPVCMQYAQQAIRSVLYDTIESSRIAGGHVNFRDQSVNQKLALMSSKTGRSATIDLSDASDRVPLSLALFMFDGNPDLRDAILACRSTRASLPDGRVIGPLQKFASMGSALCFPIEAMYFYTLCVASLLEEQNLPVTHDNCFKVSRDVYVYGDDIIVPTTYARAVLGYLQKYNCKVNTSKTFVSGNFRESCGVDAYNGYEVTPTYIRRTQPKNRQQVPELVSWVSTANSFYLKGYWRTASHMFNRIEKILGPLPYVSSNSPGLGRVSYLGYRSIERWNRNLHRFEVKAWVPSPVYRSDNIDGYAALMLSFHRLSTSGLQSDVASEDPLRLERSALYGAVALIRRWVPAH